eukprot:gene15247-7541_t
MLIIVGFIWYTAAQPQISADGETLTLTGQTIAFEVDGGRTTVETLLNKGYDKATMDEMINELRSDMKTIVDANSDKVTKLESMLASTKAELDTAKQERDEMAGKLRLLQAHADSDCRADQFYNREDGKCHECSEDPARFYSEMLNECMQCSEVADRILNSDTGECELLEPCGAGNTTQCKEGEYESRAPTRGSDRQCLPLSTCTLSETYEVCKAVGLPCSFPEYYEAAAAGESTDRVCKAVSAECDDGCDEIKAPSKSSDRVCKKPASLNGDAFKVYCLNNANIAKGGWTLIGKAGVGDWSRLSDDAYFDLILNKDKDVSPDDLLTPDRPIAGRTMAFYNEKKTNALGASTIAASQNPVFLIQMGREWFAQVRIKPDKSWSFWRAIRDMTYWSSDA